MTTTSWHKLFGLGASVALVAVACTVSSGSDDDDSVTTGIGGSGGSDAGGSGGTDAGGSGGTESSGGSAGDPGTTTTSTTTTTTTSTTGSGGTGGSDDVECLMEDDGMVPGTPGSCEIDEDTDPCCTRCVKTNCCEGYGDCFASEPNICGGSTDENSEIIAFMNCMLAIEDGATPGMDDDSDLLNCMAQAVEDVSSPLCNAGAPSGPTNDLAACMHGDMDGLDGCFLECLDANFEEDECVY